MKKLLLLWLLPMLSVAQVVEFSSDTTTISSRVGRFRPGVRNNDLFLKPRTGPALQFESAPKTQTKLDGKLDAVSSLSTLRSYGGSRSVFYDGSVWDFVAGSDVTDDGATVVTASGGRRFRRFTGTIYASWFGANGNDTGDDYAALQTAIDYAVLNTRRIRRLVIDEGRYIITNTLKVGPPVAGFINLTIEGAAKPYFDLYTTQIDATAFGDRPALNIQGARGVVIRHLAFIGKNMAPVNIPTFTRTLSSYVSAGCNNTRYSPYAAITTDAYSGPAPSGGYTNDTYNKNNSAVVTIEDCSIEQFIVGICINPSGTDTQNDTMELRSNLIRNCAYGYSVGTSQARSVLITGAPQVIRVHTVLTNRVHGPQVGQPPYVHNLDAGDFFQLHDYLGNRGAIVFRECHYEAFASLGSIESQTSNAQSVLYSGCHFHRDHYGQGGDAALFLHVRGNPVLFEGCVIKTNSTTDAAAYNLYNITADVPVKLTGCGVFDADATGQRLIGVTSVEGVRIIGDNNVSRNAVASQQPRLSEVVRGWTGSGRVEIHPLLREWHDAGSRYRVDFPYYRFAAGLGPDLPASGWSFSGSGKGATATFTTTTPQTFLVGDILLYRCFIPGKATASDQQVPALVVTGKSGSTITCRLLFDEVDTSFAPGEVQVAVTPVLYGVAGVQVNTTSGSTSVTVTGVNGAAATGSNVAAMFRVGDWIFGSGLNNGRIRITAVDGAAQTLTVSEAATATVTGVNIQSAKFTSF